MSSVAAKPMSMQEFLTWEARQETKFEFDGSQPVAMTGGTGNHAALQANLAASLVTRLRGKPCRFYGSDLKIEAAGSIRYPDGFVVCTVVASRQTVVRDPVVVFEVLSTSTAGTDRITKNQEYAATPSIAHYVMLEQDRAAATVFSRSGDDWVGHVLGAAAVLILPEIGIELPLAELYEGLELGRGDSAEQG